VTQGKAWTVPLFYSYWNRVHTSAWWAEAEAGWLGGKVRVGKCEVDSNSLHIISSQPTFSVRTYNFRKLFTWERSAPSSTVSIEENLRPEMVATLCLAHDA